MAPEGNATARIKWLLASATRTEPTEGSKARPLGLLKVAAAPAPLAAPAAPVPARRYTAADATSTQRMRLLAESATTSAAPSLTATAPWGALNCAAEPTPGEKPPATAFLLPATTATASMPALTTRTSLLFATVAAPEFVK